jgi:mevalonate kinase
MEVPSGAGLGGSAALSVAILRAMDAQLQRHSSYYELLDASLAWERVFHGNPSGVDSAMAITGGLAWYRRGEPLAPIRNARVLQLVVANSGARGDTVAMVSSVARQHQRDPAKAEQSFDAIASLVTNGKRALETGDQRDLGQLMDLNQQLLNTFMLSTTRLEELCQAARAAGALGAKLTGSGGGGCIIALAADSGAAAEIAQALRAHAADVFVMEVTP